MSEMFSRRVFLRGLGVVAAAAALTACSSTNEAVNQALIEGARLIPMIRPLLNPIAIISISTTMMTDSIRLMTKVPKELPTRSG